MRKLERNRGLTLVEILMVVVIIGVLLAVVIPRGWRARVESQYNLVRQNGVEVSELALQWAETQLTNQDQTVSTALLKDYLAYLCGRPAGSTAAPQTVWVADGNETSFVNAGSALTPRGSAPTGPPASMLQADRVIRNPFNGTDVFGVPNDPSASNVFTPGAMAMGWADNNGQFYFALIFQGTDSQLGAGGTAESTGTTFYGGMGRNLAGLRAGVFVAELN